MVWPAIIRVKMKSKNVSDSWAGTDSSTVVAGQAPSFCNIEISFDRRVIPQIKYGRPLEDSDPLLHRIFFENMIVKPADISLNDH